MRTVSVVLCTYNGADYLSEQLASVAAQTVSPVEILIADDASTDRTLEVAALFAATSAVPVRVHPNSTRFGFADNFLRASERAVGELIAFCDQDDVWLPQKLAVQIDALDRTGAAMAAHDVHEMHSDGSARPNRRSRTGRRERVVTDRTSDPWGNYLGNTLLFRADLLARIPASERGGDPFSLGQPLSHDRWLYFLALTFGGIVILPQRLARYRRHERQLYGPEVLRSVRQRLRDKRGLGLLQATALARIAADRAVLVERFAPCGPGRRRSVARWRSVQRRFERGARLYHLGLPGRIGRVAVNLVHGDYLPISAGGLGLRRMLQDGCVALLMGTVAPTAGGDGAVRR